MLGAPLNKQANDRENARRSLEGAKMRIAIVSAVYYPMINGVAVFSHNLAKGLTRRGYEVLVLTPSPGRRAYSEELDGVKVRYVKSTEAKLYPDQIHATDGKHIFYENGFKVALQPGNEVKKALDEFRPDVIHVQVQDLLGRAAMSYGKKHHIPVVTTEHNQPEVLTEPLKLPKAIRRLVEFVLIKYFLARHNKSDFMTMPTEAAISSLTKNGERNLYVKTKAVSNGVDLSKFRPGEAPAEIYEKYGLESGVPTAIYVGRVDPEKSVGAVLEAAKEARKIIPKIQLVIVGDGVDRARLEAQYAGQPEVKFLGRVVGDDLYALYKVGDVFITASEIETQGIVLIEAAATGLPLIAVDKGAAREVCRDMVNGRLCLAGNVKQMADALVDILLNKGLQREYSEASLKIAKENDFEHTLDEFIKIYKNIV